MYTYDSIHEPKQFKYEVFQSITEHLIKYTFISEGRKNILKVVHYTLIDELNGRKLFNFGFGDYNIDNGVIADNVTSDNGDAYRVFNTVLSTVPRFFEIHNNAIMVVKGSHSGFEFIDKCRTNCKKNCADICMNADRRINIYRGYVNKHFEELKMDYTFYGSLDIIDNELSLIDYEPDIKQESIVLLKNKNQHYMKTAENETQELREPTSKEEMIALFMERTEGIDLFAKQNAEAREYFKRLVLPDHLKLTKD